jgi:6-phosphofructo-2-kinase/fructose-2,6-biphosphatase 4
MNSRIKTGCVYFARCGQSDLDKYIEDDELNEAGLKFSQIMADTVLNRISERRAAKARVARLISSTINSTATSTANSSTENLNSLLRQPPTGDGSDENSFVVWTATRKRTSSSANPFRRKQITVRERSQLNQLNPGAISDLTEEEIKSQFHDDFLQDLKDPYHHRYPRAESYHDLAVRMEPLLLEMERMSGDILIIAHESTLAVLYGYLMACSCYEIPSLQFPRNEIVEISYTPYENKAERITIRGVEP